MSDNRSISNIAILTLYYHNSNYGALLQSYALQKALEEMGFAVKQISYDLDSGYDESGWIHRQKKRFNRYFSFLRPWYRLIRYGKWEVGRNAMNKKLYSFAGKIPHTKVVRSRNISSIVSDFDAFVCGSDQIWNPEGWQPTLFLNFVKKDVTNNYPLKISYAASIARDELTKEEFDYIKKFTLDYDAISVREKNLVDALNKALGRKVYAVPDPCFLLKKEDWMRLVQQSDICRHNNYIFVYVLGNSIERREEIISYSRKQNLNAIITPFLNRREEIRKWEADHEEFMEVDIVGVQDFLSLINNASLVITDSFHASVFSLIFATPFYAVGRSIGKGSGHSMNSRLISLLDDFDMVDRLVEKLPENAHYSYTDGDITKINSALRSMRNAGISYLSNSLKS